MFAVVLLCVDVCRISQCVVSVLILCVAQCRAVSIHCVCLRCADCFDTRCVACCCVAMLC